MRVYSALFVFICFIWQEVTSECTEANVCVTDMTEAQCSPGQTLVPNSNIFGCCPGCVTSAGPPIEEEGCKPPSTCLEDGKYAPVQCKGDMFTGRCFCSDEKGSRIFGQMWRSAASDMTCACSRRRAELEAEGRTDVTLHCTANGDYEPLQCDDGYCWCADAKTGQPSVPPVPEESMKVLSCYSSSVMGEQYLRRCESLVYALGVINREQTEHGTSFLGNPVTFCDYDGSYKGYQIQNGIAYCTDKEGEILGAWQAMSSQMAGMNCNCARDTMMYFPEIGMMVTETCQGNGNYQPDQNVGDYVYCVDSDGYPTTDVMLEWPEPNYCARFTE